MFTVSPAHHGAQSGIIAAFVLIKDVVFVVILIVVVMVVDVVIVVIFVVGGIGRRCCRCGRFFSFFAFLFEDGDDSVHPISVVVGDQFSPRQRHLEWATNG